MRLLFTLLLMISVLGHAHADTPVPKLKLNPSIGWRLDAVVRWERDKDIWGDRKKDFDVIVIEGDVINATDRERPSPQLRLAVRDKAGQELYHWTILADLARIRPGDYAPFSARVEQPPEDVHSVEIRTVDLD